VLEGWVSREYVTPGRRHQGMTEEKLKLLDESYDIGMDIPRIVTNWDKERETAFSILFVQYQEERKQTTGMGKDGLKILRSLKVMMYNMDCKDTM
jgi:hypothetical protein